MAQAHQKKRERGEEAAVDDMKRILSSMNDYSMKTRTTLFEMMRSYMYPQRPEMKLSPHLPPSENKGKPYTREDLIKDNSMLRYRRTKEIPEYMEPFKNPVFRPDILGYGSIPAASEKSARRREMEFEYQVTLGTGGAARTYLVRLPERLPKGGERKRLLEMLEKNELTVYENGKLVLKGDVMMVPKDAGYAKEYNLKPQSARLDVFHDRYIGDEREGAKIMIAEVSKAVKEKKG